MCCGFGVALSILFHISPFLWLLLLPCFISLGGIHLAVKYYIVILLTASISSSILSHIRDGWLSHTLHNLLCIGLLFAPVSLVPSAATHVTFLILANVEPVLVIMEAVGLVKITQLISCMIAKYDQTEDDVYNFDEDKWINVSKVMIVGISLLLYGIGGELGWIVITQGLEIHRWLLAVVLVGGVYIHFVMFKSDYGILTDSAAITLGSIMLLVSSVGDIDLTSASPQDNCLHAVSTENNSSSLALAFSQQYKADSSILWTFYMNLVSLPFILRLLLRTMSVIYCANKLMVWYYSSEEELDEVNETYIIDETQDFLVSRYTSELQTPMILKLAIQTLYTQQIISMYVTHMDAKQCDTSSDSSDMAFVLSSSFLCKLVEIIALHVVYVVSLYSKSDSEEW